MNCPKCGKEMQKGRLRSRGCNYFLPDGMKAPWVYTKRTLEQHNAIMLPPNPYTLDFSVGDWPEAYACRACRMIIMPYGE